MNNFHYRGHSGFVMPIPDAYVVSGYFGTITTLPGCLQYEAPSVAELEAKLRGIIDALTEPEIGPSPGA